MPWAWSENFMFIEAKMFICVNRFCKCRYINAMEHYIGIYSDFWGLQRCWKIFLIFIHYFLSGTHMCHHVHVEVRVHLCEAGLPFPLYWVLDTQLWFLDLHGKCISWAVWPTQKTDSGLNFWPRGRDTTIASLCLHSGLRDQSSASLNQVPFSSIVYSHVPKDCRLCVIEGRGKMTPKRKCHCSSCASSCSHVSCDLCVHNDSNWSPPSIRCLYTFLAIAIECLTSNLMLTRFILDHSLRRWSPWWETALWQMGLLISWHLIWIGSQETGSP